MPKKRGLKVVNHDVAKAILVDAALMNERLMLSWFHYNGYTTIQRLLPNAAGRMHYQPAFHIKYVSPERQEWIRNNYTMSKMSSYEHVDAATVADMMKGNQVCVEIE